MRLLIYTANLGNFDKTQKNEEQILPEGIDQIDYWRCTDTDFAPRFNAMTPRLQARIVKMFGWQMEPDYDYYLWVDSSCRLPVPGSACFFMDCLTGGIEKPSIVWDVVAFRHPNRDTIQQEADYLKERIKLEKEGRKKLYVLPRYENEDIDGALSEVDPQAQLFATTAFAYRNTTAVQEAMKEWWYLTSRYHSIDQLGFTEAFKDLNINDRREKYMEMPFLEYTR